jgi:uncharacterized protein (TIGR03083 family)
MPEFMAGSFALVDRDTARRAIADGGAALTAAGRTAPGAPVATCPGWTVSTVVKHLALVHQWAAGLLRDYPDERPQFPKAPEGISDAELPDFGDAQREVFLAALASSDGDRQVWAFGQPRPARFWWRRQTIETAIHAVDGTDAAGNRWAVPDDVGVVGIEEAMDWNLARLFAATPPEWGEGRTIHFHRTDGEGEWLLTIGNPPKAEHGHAKGDLAVRGPAAQLLLWAWNRPADVELFGDAALAEAWGANVKV